MERGIFADIAIIKGWKADESGKFMRAEMQRLIDKHFN